MSYKAILNIEGDVMIVDIDDTFSEEGSYEGD